MMKTITKYLALVLASVMTLLCVVGCQTGDTNENTDPVVLSYKDKTITASEFEFYMSIYKARFAEVYEDYRNTAEFYDSMIGDVTAEEHLFDMIVQNVTRTLVSEVLYEEKGLELSDTAVNEVEYYIDVLIYEHFSNSDEAFNKELSKYGITALQLRDIYLRDEVTYSLFTLLSADRASIGATDDAVMDFLNDNYVRIQHVYVNNKYTYLTDSSGKPVYDGSGQIMTVPMTGKELQSKNAIISSIEEALADGGEFYDIYEAFSEDRFYDNGYYLNENIDFIDEVVDAAFKLDIGEWVKVESSVGTHYLKRLPMDEKPWENPANRDFLGNLEDTVLNEKFGEYLDSFADEVTVNEDALKEFDLRTSPSNYIF